MSKSFRMRVAPGFAARAVSKASRTIPTRPSRWASGVIAFASFSNTGMITASLIASQVAIAPAKPVTSRVIRALTAASTSADGRPRSQRGAIVCQTSG